MSSFLEEIHKRILIHDGSKGYMLQKLGLKGGECGEAWNIYKPEEVRKVYRAYLEAGSDVIQTNTFPGNRIELEKYGLGDKTYEINFQGARLAREEAGDKAFVCASIGPTGLLFEPSGELTFDRAYEIFSEQVKAVADGGADVINFETFTDIAELRAAYFAARDNTKLPVICSLAFENNGRTLMGTDPFIAVLVLRSIGADMAGTNCSFGPGHMAGIVEKLYEAGGGYLSAKPNAGLPQIIDGKTVYSETPEHFADLAVQFAGYGARLIGGCCGTTPEYIRALKAKLAATPNVAASRPPKEQLEGIITSAVKYIEAGKLDINNIGYIDASKDAGLLEALKNSDLSYIEDTALDLASEGYDAIYVDIDEAQADTKLLSQVVDRTQWYVKEPLVIRTSDADALDLALRIYRGLAGVAIRADETNAEALKAVAARYGSVVVEKEF
ncbi:MAG TPA: homocysteine S-methyltransferase family protein [Clostridia bacterium]|nr:homocysteine S-methyltransferase family protein [Clostridia bacterium]